MKLLGCPKSLVSEVDGLMSRIMANSPKAGVGGLVAHEAIDGFEEDVKEHIDRLVKAMSADLEATIRGSTQGAATHTGRRWNHYTTFSTADEDPSD